MSNSEPAAIIWFLSHAFLNYFKSLRKLKCLPSNGSLQVRVVSQDQRPWRPYPASVWSFQSTDTGTFSHTPPEWRHIPPPVFISERNWAESAAGQKDAARVRDKPSISVKFTGKWAWVLCAPREGPRWPHYMSRYLKCLHMWTVMLFAAAELLSRPP